LDTGTKYPLEDTQRLVETLLPVVLAAETDLSAGVRWCNALQLALRRHTRGMPLQVQWRPLLALLRRLLYGRSQSYESASLRCNVEQSFCAVSDISLLASNGDHVLRSVY
jgi:hypothetical protein